MTTMNVSLLKPLAEEIDCLGDIAEEIDYLGDLNEAIELPEFDDTSITLFEDNLDETTTRFDDSFHVLSELPISDLNTSSHRTSSGGPQFDLLLEEEDGEDDDSSGADGERKVRFGFVRTYKILQGVDPPSSCGHLPDACDDSELTGSHSLLSVDDYEWERSQRPRRRRTQSKTSMARNYLVVSASPIPTKPYVKQTTSPTTSPDSEGNEVTESPTDKTSRWSLNIYPRSPRPNRSSQNSREESSEAKDGKEAGHKQKFRFTFPRKAPWLRSS